jgi:hypothetical protein
MTAIIIPNTFLPSTTISSTAMNSNFQAVVDALDVSLALDGSEVMTGQLKLANGLVSAPSLTFGSDLNLGIYRKATDELGFATAGTLAMYLDAAGKGWFSNDVDIAGGLDVGALGTTTVYSDFVLDDVTSRTTFAESLAQRGAGFGAMSSTTVSVNTVNLGAAPSHYININGGGTITSFGNAGSLNTPVYLVRAGDATITLVHSANIDLPDAINLVLFTNDQILVRYGGGSTWQIIGVFRNFELSPTIQRFTGGSGTYVPTAGTRWIKGRMAAAGGGGSAQATNNGVAGGNSSFGGWVANGGGGGVQGAGAGGAGGSGGANGTGTLITRVGGQDGFVGQTFSTGRSGAGGNSFFGGAGASVGNGPAAGQAAKANSGSGGSGGVIGGNNNGGSGGGAGEYVEFTMTAAQIGASLSYAVGALGAGGAAGGQAGGNGAAGQIIVEEYYA